MIKKLGTRQKYFLADIRRKNSQIYAYNLFNNLVSVKFCVKILRSSARNSLQKILSFTEIKKLL